jgi:hypothetical protein
MGGMMQELQCRRNGMRRGVARTKKYEEQQCENNNVKGITTPEKHQRKRNGNTRGITTLEEQQCEKNDNA